MQRELVVLYDGQRAGTLTLHFEGLYVRAEAACRLPSGALYRLTLCAAQGTLPLGVLEPENGVQTLRCRLPRERLRALGEPTRGEAMRSFYLDGAAHWQRVDGRFFADAQLQRALEACPDALWRGEGVRELALPYDAQRPFPLVQCFCLARVGELSGKPTVFYRFDAQDMPLF